MGKIKNLIAGGIQRAKEFYARDKRAIIAGLIGFVIAFVIVMRFG